MRLAAVYIPENCFPFIFGENHKGETINFGGEYFYFFTESSTDIILEKRIHNDHFIQNFHNDNISLLSAVVGQNGAGKTTLLRAFNHSIDPKSKEMVYVFEDQQSNEPIKIYNETKKGLIVSDDIVYTVIEKKPFEPLYYSPNLDYDLRDTFSPIALIKYLEDDLEAYFLDSVTRNVSFLNDRIINTIKEVYSDFPSYDFITVRAKKHRKSRFIVPYLESNFGTPHRGDALKNELKGELSRFEHDKDYGKGTYTRDEIIKMYERDIHFLESESFTEQFNKLWEIEDYNYKDETGYDYIHNSTSFLKSVEINILSFLLLGAVFPQTGLGGGMDFSIIGNTQNFKERLDVFLEMYLVNEYRFLASDIKEKISFDVSKGDQIIDFINKDTAIKISGVELAPIRERMKSYVEALKNIYNFYVKLIGFCENGNIHFEKDRLTFNVKNNAAKLLFEELIFTYKFVLKSFPKSPANISLLEFLPSNSLSTGEKAILDFYSSIYTYIETNKESLHLNYEYFLLLLDEPDLGYHPVWKKKFVEAISSTLPILFSKMTPHQYDSENKNYKKIRENPILQIILATHDPLTLSDISNNSVNYLKKGIGNSSIILKNESALRPQKSFGANISDLLANSFFIDDGLIGDFAKKKIQDVIDYINLEEKRGEIRWIKSPEIARKAIHQIGEPYLNNKLNDMFLEEFPEFNDDEIKRLEEKINQLRNDSNSNR